MRSGRTLTFVALVCALGLGCKAKSEAEQQGEVVAEQAEHIVSEAPMYPQALVLEEPGAEPRETLHYSGPIPAREISLATHTSGFDEGISEDPFVDVRIRWEGSGPGLSSWKVMRLEGEIVSAQGNRFSRGIAKAFENVAGRVESSASGMARVVQTSGMQTTPNIPTQLDLFVVPLPEDPIGIGASWTATATYTLEARTRQDPSAPSEAGGEVTMVERYTLIARQGQELTIEYELSNTAAFEGFMPSSAKGNFIVNLDDPLVFEGAIEHRAQVAMPAVEGVESTARFNRQRFVLRTP